MALPQSIDRDCCGDVERSLLRLAASPDGPVKLLLTGDDAAGQRGLYNRKVSNMCAVTFANAHSGRFE